MNAVALIAEQARTNQELKGYTPEHDDTHTAGELIDAAWCYVGWAGRQVIGFGIEEGVELDTSVEQLWPFEPEAWKPSNDPIRNLVHAGALIVAEIERLQRLQARPVEVTHADR